ILGEGALLSAKIIDLMLSLGGMLLLFVIAYRLSSNTIIAFASALVWGASPLESMLSAGPQDFTLFTFLILLSLYCYLFHPHSIAGMAIFFFPPLLLALAVAALMQLKERVPDLMFLFIWVVFCLFFYGPFLDNRRYYIHLLPFIAMFSLIYLEKIWDRAFTSY